MMSTRLHKGSGERTGTLFRYDLTLLPTFKRHAIIAGTDDLIRMRELPSSVLEPRLHIPSTRNNDNLAAFSHPDSWLVCPLEAVYGRVGVVVWRDRDIVLTRLRDPACHRERRSRRGYHPARSVGRVAAIADETARARSE